MNNYTELLIASNNAHKAEEIKNILSDTSTQIFTLKDKDIDIEVIEDRLTLEENALKKAKEIYDVSKIPVISDDTGLFVEALGGKPGVFSARYAGEGATYEDNCNKLIEQLKSHTMSTSPAYFKTVICLYVDEDEHHFFEGVCKGKIITEARGEKGFGYDPIFIPKGFIKTFGELSPEEKNKVSHRGRAVEGLRDFLNEKKH